MEPINTSSLFESSRWISNEVQAIAGEIETSPISERKYLDLSQRLDVTFRAIQQLETLEKTSQLFIKTQTESLKETCIELSQHLENAFVEREISLIQNDSVALCNNGATPQAIKKIEAQMNALLNSHTLSIEQSRSIEEAKSSLESAKTSLSRKGETVHHIDYLSKQRNVHWVEMNALLPEEIEELFEIAKSVYDRNFKQAKMRFQMLPESQKRQFEDHIRFLAAKPFEDVTATIQAFIATANDLVGNGRSYPTYEQIDELYLGLLQVNEEESLEGKIFSLESKKISGA